MSRKAKMIPAFSATGVLPPFFGDPASAHRSPYAAGIHEVVRRFATSARRCDILRGWLQHRADLHALGFVDGFQWVDGSFCERLDTREPNDVDLVTFFVKPMHADLKALLANHRYLFDPTLTKSRYLCDVYFQELQELHGRRFADPRRVSYWYSLFSHRRDDFAWKGILEVSLAATHDPDAMNLLTAAPPPLPLPVAP